jgi:chromosome segregation ATPase
VVTNNYTDSSFQVVEDHNEVSAERNSLKDQKPVGEREVNGFEYQIRSKDEDIRRLEHEHELAMKDTRRLEHELAMKDEEMRRLKSQLDLREKEFASLRTAIWSACTDLSNAVNTADDALKFKNKSPSKKGIEHFYTEEDLYGAVQSAKSVPILFEECTQLSISFR